MLVRFGRSRCAARGCLIAALIAPVLVGGAFGEQPNRPITPTPAGEASHDTGHAQVSRPFYPTKQEPYSTDYEARCRHPEDREEADLCQQWRSAQAAEELVGLTDRQLFWTIISNVALIGALVVSAVATFFAGKATRAAITATDLARAEIVAAHPPIIRITQVILDVDRIAAGNVTAEEEIGAVWVYNCGANTATIDGATGGGFGRFGNIILHIGRHPPPGKPFDGPEAPECPANPLRPPSGEMKPGQGYWWPISDVSMINRARLGLVLDKTSKVNLFVIGRVHFRDTLENHHTTVFCRRYDKGSGRFVEAGYPDYEYQT
jgi:hypothetical protein